MNKYIAWIGGAALLTASVTYTMLAGAAVGDAVFVRRSPTTTLTSGQKTKLGTAIVAVYPSADPQTADRFYCLRNFRAKDESAQNDLYCDGDYDKEISAAEYVQLEAAGEAGEIKSNTGGIVTVPRKAPRVKASAAGVTAIMAFLTDPWPFVEQGTLADFVCERDQTQPTQIDCVLRYFTTASPADYVAAKQAKVVVKFVGIVQE